MTWMNTLRPLALGSAILVGVAACAITQRIETADLVADAGIAYADSLPPVLDESFVLSVTADSLVLAKVRGDIPEVQRATRLERSDDLLTQRLEILRYLKQHALLLRSYFIAMKSITETNAAGITDATTGLVAKMATIRPKIAEASIGGATIGDLVGPVVKLGVAAHQYAVLRRELQERAEAIERELDLQRAALTAISDQMLADKDLQIQTEDRDPLLADYVGEGTLPSNWSERRIAAFRHTAEFESLNSAAKVAGNLRESWIAFVENRLDAGSILLLIRDIEELAQLAEIIRGEKLGDQPLEG